MKSHQKFSGTQRQRLLELGAAPQTLEMLFESEVERNRQFNALSKGLARKNRERLDNLRTILRRPALTRTWTQLAELLIGAGFVEVVTPALLARGLLMKMNILEHDSLWKQIFWIDKNRCLRPMLAPNLYFLLGYLQRLWTQPIRIFEIGSCWRKESQGARHLEEFTMLNLVELGCQGAPECRLVELADLLMQTLGLSYEIVKTSSKVYGLTMDVVCDGVEVASCATGPHPLDRNWDIVEPWAGLGMGLERVCCLTSGNGNVQRMGRSLIYLDGARLNI